MTDDETKATIQWMKTAGWHLWPGTPDGVGDLLGVNNMLTVWTEVDGMWFYRGMPEPPRKAVGGRTV